MRNVTLIVGGRDYVVACETGEEAHVATLGRIIDEALAAMPPAVGQSESRSLLFAALLLADEVHEARHSAGAAPSPAALERLAARLEAIAGRIEGAAVDGADRAP